ncbi:hypothetical protein BH23DEI1_BH23DEI1_22030 [soil metagenome]|nr:SRPBCC family protein [Trueperaceae bacterium]
MRSHSEESTGRGRKTITLTVEEAPTGRRRGADDDGGGGAGKLVPFALAAIGGYLFYKRMASRGSPGNGAIHVSKSVTIERPAGQIYRYWRNLENLPRVMGHLESVRELPDGRSHWTAKGPAGITVEWDAEILVDRENEIISWRSVEGATVPNEGTVRFKDIGNGQRTEVKVSFTYHPPGGAIGAGIAKLFGEEPSKQVDDDLRRLKEELETGSVMTSSYATTARR